MAKQVKPRCRYCNVPVPAFGDVCDLCLEEHPEEEDE